MSNAQLAYGFTAGMLAAVNPCGFALLPAYLSYYLGTDDGDDSGEGAGLLSALWVSGAMTLGFLAVFAPLGALWSTISDVVGRHLPWVTLTLGIALVVLGAAMLRGFQPVVRLPKLDVGAGTQRFWSMFLFGVSYAVASLSCTIPIFAAVMSATFASGFLSGIAAFVAYGLGMGAVVAVLTVAVAFARQGLVRSIRRLLPLIGRISGALIVVAGLYVAYSGWAELQIFAGRTGGTGAFAWFQERQGQLQSWIDRTGAGRLGLVALLVVAAAASVGVWMRRRRPDHAD